MRRAVPRYADPEEIDRFRIWGVGPLHSNMSDFPDPDCTATASWPHDPRDYGYLARGLEGVKRWGDVLATHHLNGITGAALGADYCHWIPAHNDRPIRQPLVSR